MRGNASRHPDKRETQAQAEARMVMFLTSCRPIMRDTITVDSLVASHRVPPRVAEYRLLLARQRWAAETTERTEA